MKRLNPTTGKVIRNRAASHARRADNPDLFTKLSNGKFGGYRPGVQNGKPKQQEVK